MSSEIRPEMLYVALLLLGPAVSIALGYFARGWLSSMVDRLEELEKSHKAMIGEFRELELLVKADHASTLKVLGAQIVQSASEVGELKKLKPDVDALHSKVRQLQAGRTIPQ